MSATIAQFNDSEISDAIASIVVTGETSSDKKLSVVANGSTAVRLFASNMKGNVGKEARSGLQAQGMSLIASAARRGSYRPLAEALSLITGTSTTIGSRSSFESLLDRYQPALDSIVLEGKAWKGDKMTTKASMYSQCIMLINATYDGVNAIIASE
jgi:hypothetical protein